MCLLSGNKAIVEDNTLKSQLIQRGFGEKKEKYLVLDLKEALYLLDRGELKLKDARGKAVSRKQLLKTASREKNFHSKYVTYKDVRERGFVIKTGFKFGFDFRVYPRGKKPGEEHTQWVLHVCSQDEKFSMPETSRMVRMAGNLKTKLLLAVVDSEDDVNYYEIERITP